MEDVIKKLLLQKGERLAGNVPRAISIEDDVRILRSATLSIMPNGKIMMGDRVHIGGGTIIFGGVAIKVGRLRSDTM